jgi:hypothetical protein
LLLMIAILTGVKWNIQEIVICISSMKWCWTFFHVFFGHLDFFFWKNSVCSFAHLFIRSLILGSLVFWAPYIIWLLIAYKMYIWKRFSIILWVALSIWWLFLLLQKLFYFLVVLFANPFS